MARSYRRDARGRFAGSSRKGDNATTIQQDKAAHARTQRATVKSLAGKLGTRKGVRANRNKTIGGAASNRRLRAALAAARRRLS